MNGVEITSTAAELNVLDGIPSTLTANELGYVDGVTSSIQTQLDAKGTLTNQNALITLSGVSAGSTTLGTFTGSTISDDKDIKVALQELETELESVAGGGAQAVSVSIGQTDTNSDHFITFVSDNNASPTQEQIKSDAGITYNPSTNHLTVAGSGTFSGNVSIAGTLTYEDVTNVDSIGVITARSGIHVNSGGIDVTGVATATQFVGPLTGNVTGNLTGNADTATTLATPRSIELTGDVVGTATTFDGSSNISIAATIQPNSVALGNDTTGNYIQTITGTANEITVTGSGSESADVTIALPDDVTIGDSLTVTNDASIGGALTVTGRTNVGFLTAMMLLYRELQLQQRL